MHIEYTSDHPGDCPICGMKLVLKKQQPIDANPISEKSESSQDHLAHSHQLGAGQQDNSNHSIQISPERQKSIGVKTAKSIAKEMESRILSSGQVVYDPELYTALVEYKEARKFGSSIGGNFLQSSKTKLLRMGLDSSDLQIWANKNSEIFLSGRSGSTAYVFTQVFERDLRHLKKGQKVTVEANSYPGKSFPGKIIGWFKLLDEKNRSTRVWIEISDPKSLLQPRMFTETRMDTPIGKVLTVPRSAVMHTGIRDIIYVKIGEDRFQPTSVTIGEETEEMTQILSGIKEGDEVVVGANFLIDSEARMQLGRNL
jgi:Cu(I)/Ag(I) efflux system membrane fusion protein